MTVWTFVRHGQSTANAEGWFAGQLDAPLTEQGRDEARRAAMELAGIGFDRVVSSDLQRALETARIIEGGLGRSIVTTAALRERSSGEWEGRAIDDLAASGELDRMRTFDGRPPGGESLRDVAKRSIAALVGHATGGHVLVVAHGALMRAVLGVIDVVPRASIGQLRPGNCEWYTRTVERDRLVALLDGLRRDAPND